MNILQPSDPGRWKRLWGRTCTKIWSWLGPRQIFPALDDLQLLCAYVDVHEEMLMRGDRGLRLVLGQRMLMAFERQIERAKGAVYKLECVYPDSFPYAMICHGAIFLVNLKIQVSENISDLRKSTHLVTAGGGIFREGYASQRR